jgi:uncharacterized protein
MSKEIMKEMHLAIREGDTATALNVLGAHPELINEVAFWGTWLHEAADHGNLELVQRLVERGADVNIKGGVKKGTAINEAAAEGHLEVVQYLFQHGAVLEADEPERDPLFGAVTARHLETVKFLVEHGIDIHKAYDTGTNKRRTALQFAQGWGCPEIVEYLQSRGAGLDAVPAGGAASSNSQAVFDYLSARFGEVSSLSLQQIIEWSETPIQIHAIPCSAERNSMILFTTGMSAQAMNVPSGSKEYRFAELMIELPGDWPLSKQELHDARNRWPFDWLRQIAEYPHQAKTWLGGRSTILTNDDPPEPLGPGVGFSSILLIADYQGAGPATNDGVNIHIHTLIPLYAEEKALEESAGLPALVEQLSQLGDSRMVRIDRPNVASR